MAKEIKELTPRSVSYSQWYQDLVIKAELADQFHNHRAADFIIRVHAQAAFDGQAAFI